MASENLSPHGTEHYYQYSTEKRDVLNRLDEVQYSVRRAATLNSGGRANEHHVKIFNRIYPEPEVVHPSEFKIHPQYEKDLGLLRTWYWSSVQNLLKLTIRKLINSRQQLLYSGNIYEKEIIQLLDWLRELKEPSKNSRVASNVAEAWRDLRNQDILERINRTSFFEKRLRSIEDFLEEGGKKHQAFYYLSNKLSYEDLIIFHINYISVSTEDKTKLLVRLIYTSLGKINRSIKELQNQLTSSQYRYFEPLLKLVVAKMFPDVYRQIELRRLCQEISHERIKKTVADWTSDFNLILPLLFGATIAVAPVLAPLFLVLELGGLLLEASKRIEEQKRVTAINDLQKLQIIDEAIVKKQDENPERSLITGIMTDILLSGIFKLGSRVGAKISSQRKINDFIAEWGDDVTSNVKKMVVAKKSERGTVDISRSNTRDLDKVNKQKDRILAKTLKKIQETYLKNASYAREKINNMAIRPSNISTFYGRSVGQLKRKIIKAIQNNPNHPLSVLFENGKLIRPSSRHHDVLGNDPRIIEMFHAESKHALDINQKEIVIIGGAFKNQRMGATIERYGWQQTPVALDIGGFAVDEDLVVDLIASGYWEKEILSDSFRVELPISK